MTTQPELVLTIPVAGLQAQGCKPEGLVPFNLDALPQKDFAFDIRDFLDSKTDKAIEHGKLNPQLLGYIQLVDKQGRTFAYQRKGKEKGLFGKWSIGVGGHVDKADYKSASTGLLSDVVIQGTLRELAEELSIDPKDINLSSSDFRSLLYSYADKTSMVHVGLPLEMLIDDVSKLHPHPSEFCNFTWLTPQQLKSGDREWETWSQLLIEDITL